MLEEKFTNICDEGTIQMLKPEQMGESGMPYYWTSELSLYSHVEVYLDSPLGARTASNQSLLAHLMQSIAQCPWELSAI